MWSMQNTLARYDFEIVKTYCPYYFYLHSKVSDFFYRLDRRFAPRVPALFATQWIILARGAPESDGLVSRVSVPGPLVTALVTSVAIVQSLAVKSLDLGLRVWHRSGGGGEET